ncbi:MAG: hypothetical protein JRJ51_15710 [Deltaproteobacteria bacterium]|nr:hypothetical protein [Deltaproteobacteria bacterium]
MTKEKLVEKITELLKTDMDLPFLLELKKEEIETLVACIRDRMSGIGWTTRESKPNQPTVPGKSHVPHIYHRRW